MLRLAIRMVPIPDVGVLPEPLQVRELIRWAVLVLPLATVVDVHIYWWRRTYVVVGFRHRNRLVEFLLY
jgi:hypothetical protein